MNLKIGGIVLSDGVLAWMDMLDQGNAVESQESVVLKADILLVGSRTAIQATALSVNRQLERAAKSQIDATVPKVYVEVDSGSGYVRSEVVKGTFEVSSEYYQRLNCDFAPARLIIERKNWWEGAETPIRLDNANGGNTIGLNVFNANDGAGTAPNQRVNYAMLNTLVTPISGDLPAPIKLTLSNTYTENLGFLWVGANLTNPDTVTWRYAPSAPSSGYITDDYDHSPEQTWNLTAAQVAAFAGQRVRMFIRAGTGMNLESLKMRVELATPLGVLHDTGWIRPDVRYGLAWLELADLRIPPYLAGMTGVSGLSIKLYFKRLQTVSTFWKVDDLMLIPADGFVYVETKVAPSEVLVLDGGEGKYYKDNAAGTAKVGAYKQAGDPIVALPGKPARFYFLQHQDQTMTAPPGEVMQVKASYRPRRLTA